MRSIVSQVPSSNVEIESLCQVTEAAPAEAVETCPEGLDTSKSPPDAIKLTLRCSQGEDFKGPRSVPGAVTRPLPRELATDLAIQLNREAMRKAPLQCWYVVAYVKNGFSVVRILPVSGWEPDSEYATPQSNEEGLFNVAARVSMTTFNRYQLSTGNPKFWQLLVKPLEYPRVNIGDDMNPIEMMALECIHKIMPGAFKVVQMRSGEISIQFGPMLSDFRWDANREKPEGLAKRFRGIAARFSRAAEAIQPRKIGVSLHAVQPNSRLIRIGNTSDVHLLVGDVRSDEEAFQRARETLATAGV